MPLTLGVFHPDPLGQAANLTMEDRLTHRSYTHRIHPCGFVEMRGTRETAKIFRGFKPFFGSILTKNLALQQWCGSDRIQIFYFWLLDF
jgi:hypothetical protein